MILQFNSTIRRVSTATEPKCLRITIDTQELREAEAAKLIGLKDKYAWCALKDFDEGQIENNDLNIPEYRIEFKGEEKSPSKRFRDLLFVLHAKKGKQKEDFDAAYKKYYNQLCDKIKGDIDDLD